MFSADCYGARTRRCAPTLIVTPDRRSYEHAVHSRDRKDTVVFFLYKQTRFPDVAIAIPADDAVWERRRKRELVQLDDRKKGRRDNETNGAAEWKHEGSRWRILPPVDRYTLKPTVNSSWGSLLHNTRTRRSDRGRFPHRSLKYTLGWWDNYVVLVAQI